MTPRSISRRMVDGRGGRAAGATRSRPNRILIALKFAVIVVLVIELSMLVRAYGGDHEVRGSLGRGKLKRGEQYAPYPDRAATHSLSFADVLKLDPLLRAPRGSTGTRPSRSPQLSVPTTTGSSALSQGGAPATATTSDGGSSGASAGDRGASSGTGGSTGSGTSTGGTSSGTNSGGGSSSGGTTSGGGSSSGGTTSGGGGGGGGTTSGGGGGGGGTASGGGSSSGGGGGGGG
jgi:hypothetical protein